MKKMNILVTIDKNYLAPLLVMLNSLFINNKNSALHIYLIHNDLEEAMLSQLYDLCRSYDQSFTSIEFNDDIFAQAPTLRHYTTAMYYRLAAYKLLPESVKKILYIDPDTLIINPIDKLYDMDISRHLFAAASHSGLTNITKHINRFRHGITAEYFNSGVLLMNIERQRSEMDIDLIAMYIEKNSSNLFLPDQDLLNILYGDRILPLDDSLYNYDIRKFETYKILSSGTKDMDWVLENTVILHFCGRKKPWLKDYIGKFSNLYKEYENLYVNSAVTA